jgi:hypothetical protein
MTVVLVGLGVSTSQAVALGPIYRMERGPMPVSPRIIDPGDVHLEIARLEDALAASQRALQAVRHQVSQASPLSLAEFIDSHLLILEDAALVEPARDLIRNHLCSAEWALRQHRDDLARIFDEMDDPYLRSRRDDIDQVIHHILGFLASGTPGAPPGGPRTRKRDLRLRYRRPRHLPGGYSPAPPSRRRGPGDRVWRPPIPHRHPGPQPQHSRGHGSAQRHPLPASRRDPGGGWRGGDRHRRRRLPDTQSLSPAPHRPERPAQSAAAPAPGSLPDPGRPAHRTARQPGTPR